MQLLVQGLGFSIWRSFPFHATLEIRISQPPKNTLDSSQDNSSEYYKDLRIKLSIRMIEKLEELRKELDLESRSSVIERLIEIA